MQPLWTELASRAGLDLGEDQQKRLEMYLDLLADANTRMNLTRITDREAARIQHVGDALTALPLLPPGAIRLADVGSGGGVPGIPLAIARLDATVVLIESTGKKADFLRSAIAALSLRNISVITARAEDVGRSDQRETFDVAISRAVGTIDWLIEWCLPLVKKGGCMLAMKGPKVRTELPGTVKTIKMLGGGAAEVLPVPLQGPKTSSLSKSPRFQKRIRVSPELRRWLKASPLR